MSKLFKSILLTFAPLIAGIAITISYIPQIYLTYTTKNVESQSLSFWIILNIALLGLVLQQIGLLKYTDNKNPTGLIVQSLNLLFSLLMTTMVIAY